MAEVVRDSEDAVSRCSGLSADILEFVSLNSQCSGMGRDHIGLYFNVPRQLADLGCRCGDNHRVSRVVHFELETAATC